MRYLYTGLFYLALPWIFLRLLWRSRRAPEYRQRWLERLGFCPQQLSNSIWVHSVSVGETIAAIPLIQALLKRYPHHPLIVTTMTPTGAARVRAAFGDSVKHTYIPYDVPDAVARFLARVNPQIVIIMETELWPNLLAACQQRHIPVLLTNARLSAQSAAGYQRVAALTRTMLATLNHIAVQSADDAKRFITLGMPENRMTITGNIKFDMEAPANIAEKGAELRNFLGAKRLVWVAASTHEGEEELVLQAHAQIRSHYPDALLILVPRHPERFQAVAQLAMQHGFHTLRRSEVSTPEKDIAVYLGDTMGEMMLFFAAADVAFVGGSLVPTGGHNLLEPALLGKPVVSGLHLFNFAAISDMLTSAKALTLVSDPTTLALAVTEFFADAEQRETAGNRARQVVMANRGALTRQLELIYGLIKS